VLDWLIAGSQQACENRNHLSLTSGGITPSKPSVTLDVTNLRVTQVIHSTLSECALDGVSCALHEIPMSALSSSLPEEAASMVLDVLERFPTDPHVLRYLFHHRDNATMYIYTTPCYWTLSDAIRKRAMFQRNRTSKSNSLCMYAVTTIANACKRIVKALIHFHSYNVVLGYLTVCCTINRLYCCALACFTVWHHSATLPHCLSLSDY
jgi:hypothetical protein